MSLWVKICGITSADDAHAALEAGADAIGVNLVPSSRRAVDIATARLLREAVGDRAEVVAVVADLGTAELEELRERTGIETLQLHGSESPEELARLLPDAYKAVRVADASDVASVRGYAGALVLVDAKVAGELGGTGHTFDWSLVTELAKERKILLAGGLTPDNVAGAVRLVRPHGVDTASGVEGADPRRKDPKKMLGFVQAAKSAWLGLALLATGALLGCSSTPQRQLIAPGTPVPGVVAGMFEVTRCRDRSGGPVTPGSRMIVALAPPGLVGPNRSLRKGTYPAGVITLLDQRVGYEGVLITQGTREGPLLIYRSAIETLSGRDLVEEIRLPFDLVGNGKLWLGQEQAGPGGTVDDSHPPHQVLLRCELVVLTPGLDRAEGVDYEPRPRAEASLAPETQKAP